MFYKQERIHATSQFLRKSHDEVKGIRKYTVDIAICPIDLCKVQIERSCTKLMAEGNGGHRQLER
jgi:hypothetical protein